MATTTHPGDLLTPGARLRITIVLGLLTALGPFTIDLFVPAFPAMASGLSTSASAIQATLAGATIGLAVGQLVIGPWSDAIGRRLPLVVSTALHVVASLLCAAAGDPVTLTLLRVLMGAAAAGGGVVAFAMVRDLYTGYPMLRLSTRLAMINGLAPILAPVIGSALLIGVSWRGLFVVLAAYGALIIVLSATLLPETLPSTDRHGGGLRALTSLVRDLFRDRLFVVIIVINGALWGSQFSYIAGSPFLLQDVWGFSVAEFGLSYAVIAAAYVGGSQLAGLSGPRLTPPRMLTLAAAVMTVAAVVLLVALLLDLRVVAFIAIWFSVLGVGVALPCGRAVGMDRVDRGAGTAAAVLGAASFGIAGVITPIAGVETGTPGLAMVVCMLVCSVAAVALSAWLQRTGQAWRG